MSEKFKGKYRIESTRLKKWDYGWNAFYFITICTQNRECYFGDVVNGEMILNDIGKIVKTEWLKTFEMRPDMNLLMGEFVIMPNHFHAIIGIGENEYNTQWDTEYDTQRDAQSLQRDAQSLQRDAQSAQRRGAMHCASTIKTTENIETNNIPKSKNQFGPQSKNLASVMRGFKIGVTKNARQIIPDFAWQSRFHDHIIRDEKSFHHISEYIKNNPLNWSKDEFR